MNMSVAWKEDILTKDILKSHSDRAALSVTLHPGKHGGNVVKLPDDG